MPSLAEQIIPRRKLLLMASETVILSAILLLGTSYPPLASGSIELNFLDLEQLRGVLSCLTIAILCQASLSYNDLYDWKISQNRAELPNRLLHSAGYALVMLACLVFALPELSSWVVPLGRGTVLGAPEAIRPTLFVEVLPTCSFGVEPKREFRHGEGKRRG